MRAFLGAVLFLPVLVLAGCGPTTETNEAPSAANATVEAVPQDASWSLDSTASRIAFASIKAGEVIETHFFPGLTGEITADGQAMVSVPLDQVETKIDLRNERMREMFFQTGEFPTAVIRTAVIAQAFSALATGERRQTEIDGTLSLHGAEAPIFVDAYVTRIAPTRIEIESAAPVIVYVSDFGLEAGLEALRDVAGLPAITSAVPVTFTFVFETDA